MSEVVPKEALAKAIEEAIKSSKKRRFKQSVELIVVLRDVDIRSTEGRIRETVFLPHPPKKEVKICVIADGDMALKAKEAGAFRIVSREELKLMAENKKLAKKLAQECDWVLIRTDMMGQAGRVVGPTLGPRGKIPVPVPITADIKAAIDMYRRAVFVKIKDQPQIMCRIGTEDMSPKELAENALAVISTVASKLKNPRYNIAKIVVKTTMGPAIEVKK